MKSVFIASILIFIGSALASAEGNWSRAYGRSYFPMMISVSDSESKKPIVGAKVHIEFDARELPSDTTEPSTSIRRAFFEPRHTDNSGLASLHYFARWKEHSVGTYFRYIRGTVVVDADGYESAKIDLQKFQAEKGYNAEEAAALYVRIDLVSKKANKPLSGNRR